MKKLLATLAALAVFTGMPAGVYAAPEKMPDGGIFDAEYYAENNPDVTAALGTDPAILYRHYLLCGKEEGRQPYANGGTRPATLVREVELPDGTVFDPVYYALNNRDVVAALGTSANVLAQHYLTCGKAEGRYPSAAAAASQNPSGNG